MKNAYCKSGGVLKWCYGRIGREAEMCFDAVLFGFSSM
jgi:hypothetical protein